MKTAALLPPASATRKKLIHQIYASRYLLFMALPAVIYYIMFCYIPMYGIVIGFKDFQMKYGFSILENIANSPWVGLKHIKDYFNSMFFWRNIRNTLLLYFYSLIFGFPLPILFALLLNEMRNEKAKKVVQTISYLPHFISSVAICSMVTMFLSTTGGFVNTFLTKLGVGPIYFLGDARYLLDGFTSAFHTNSNFWVVPESNALEYGPASDNYRDMMIYLNKMYAEGLIDREFPTTTSDQHKEYTANGRNIAEFTYSTRAQWANDLLVEGLVGGWAWTGGFISAYPDQYAEGLAIPDQAFFPIGQLWTAALQDEEKIYRLAAWLDFVSTDKGADISTFGIEGETFYYDENGWAHDMSNTNTYLTNSNVYLGSSYLTRYSYGWMVDNDKLSDLEFSEAIAGKPTYILISYEYDNAQQSRMATLSTQLQSVRDEWGVRFIMGSADPSDDAQWASYLDNLKTAGLEEALEINSATVKVSK